MLISCSIFAITSLIIIRRIVVSSWGSCKNKISLAGKTVIITGANSGIGKATACELAKRNAKVIMACRDISKAQSAINDIRKSTGNGELIFKHLDLQSFASIHEFANTILETEPKIDILINNAGIFQPPFTLTEEGLESQMGVNHFGHFLLTNLLLERLLTSTPSRIIVVTSALYKKAKLELENLNSEKGYDKSLAYANSKLANIMFVRELARRYDPMSLSVFAVSPGFVKTNLARHIEMSWIKKIAFLPIALLFLRTPYQGCQTILHCATEENLKSGGYYRNCKLEKYESLALDDELCKKLWCESERITKLVER